MKKCFKCSLEKPLEEFYKHKQMLDGHLNKCKPCTKNDVKERENILRQNIDYIEKERERGREKYYRLNYVNNKPNKESKKIIMQNYKNKYPEKILIKSKLGKKLKAKEGYNLHHWSYNIEHALDIIELSIKEHNLAHRFIIYDQERMMYRDTNGILLDTKESHYDYIINKIKLHL
jgi:hypothetical protein